MKMFNNFLLHLVVFAGNYPIIYWAGAAVLFIVLAVMAP